MSSISCVSVAGWLLHPLSSSMQSTPCPCTPSGPNINRHPALKPLCIYHRHQRAWEGPPVGITIPNNLKLAPATSLDRRLRLLDAFTSPQHNLLVLFAGRWVFVTVGVSSILFSRTVLTPCCCCRFCCCHCFCHPAVHCAATPDPRFGPWSSPWLHWRGRTGTLPALLSCTWQRHTQVGGAA